MAQYDFDLFIIGAGSGGVRAGRVAARLGARVAVCERGPLGGTCVNVGCVPKKLLVYASHFSEQFEDAAGFGWDVGARSVDWSKLIANKDKEILRLNGIYERLLDDAGARTIRGTAVVKGPHEVEVDGETFTAERILVATGGRPFVPDIPGAGFGITSDEFFHLEALPARMTVVGGGYIGVELAGVLHGLGVEVQLIHRGPVLLRGFDEDISGFLTDEIRKKGIELHLDTEIWRIEREGSSLQLLLHDGETIQTDGLLWAAGRVPNTSTLGLQRVGVELSERGAVIVNEEMQSTVPSIYAIGDVIDHMALTPVALAQGMILARRLFDKGPATVVDYEAVPTAVFSQPEIGTVGLTEREARERCDDVEIYRSTFTPMKHTLSGRKERSMMKLVVDKGSDRVLGVHVVGPDAGEMVQGFAVALNCGATKAQFDRTIGIHPSAAEELVTMREPIKRDQPRRP